MSVLARWARAEWGPLWGTVREPLTAGLRRMPRAIPMTLTAVALTALLQLVQNQSWGYRPVQQAGAVRAADPLGVALLRTPLSLFVPALDLPVWGALLQILFVFGISEICLGWWRTLTIAYVATLAGTLYARVGIALGPGGPLGLPASDARVVDTGPSAAVVGLAVYIGWRYGARVTAGAVVVAMAAEVAVKENLAGKEHVAAVVAVTALLAAGAGTDHRPHRPHPHAPSTPAPDPRPRPAPDSDPGPGSGSGPDRGPGLRTGSGLTSGPEPEPRP